MKDLKILENPLSTQIYGDFWSNNKNAYSKKLKQHLLTLME